MPGRRWGIDRWRHLPCVVRLMARPAGRDDRAFKAELTRHAVGVAAGEWRFYGLLRGSARDSDGPATCQAPGGGGLGVWRSGHIWKRLRCAATPCTLGHTIEADAHILALN